MATKQPLGTVAQQLVSQKVDELFERLKVRFLGSALADKRIIIQFQPDLTLPAIFAQASAIEGVRADAHTQETLINIVSKYLDATRERTKAQTLQAVTTFLSQAQSSGVKTSLETVLGGQLQKVIADASRNVHTILDAEVSNAKNVGILDGITRINQYLGVEDPVVYFVVVRDEHLCKECRRLHLLEDGVTPRLWRMSSLSHGYHRRGDDAPAVGGLHPHCRCTMATLMAGYGFTASGAVEYKNPTWNEFERQQGS